MTETWLTKYHFNLEILPNDYLLYRNDRETRGGGVLIAANQNVPSSQRQLLTDPITIVCGVLCGVYVHPTRHHLILMMSLLILIPFQKPEILSLEISDIDWYSLTHGILLLKIFATFYLKIILASLSHRLRIYMETFLT